MKYFCVSDVHSFFTLMKEALEKAGYDSNNSNHTLILCGDAFDRGDESKQMLEFLQSLPQDRFIYVRGNHEDLLKEAVQELMKTGELAYYHYTNGTVKTICDLTDINTYDIYFMKNEVEKKIQPVLDWIDSKCIDYFELNKYIFVHGWIPCLRSDKNMYHSRNVNFRICENWRELEIDSWRKARWYNGMDAWNQGVYVPGKTIVCGHWHSSWGNHFIHGLPEEFPENIQDTDLMLETFSPFLDDGIAAIDSCVAYSGFVNVFVVED